MIAPDRSRADHDQDEMKVPGYIWMKVFRK